MIDLVNLLIALAVMGPMLWSEWRCKRPDESEFLRKIFGRKHQMTGNSITPLGPLEIAKAFSDRAIGLRKMANRVLAAIVLVIGVCIAIFSLAYALSNDAGSPVKLNELTDHIDKLQVSISDRFKMMGVAASSLISALEAGGCGTKRFTPTLTDSHLGIYSIKDEQLASDFGEKTLMQIASDEKFENFNLYISVRSQWVSPKEEPIRVPTETLYVNKNEVVKCIGVFKTTDSVKEIANNARLANLRIAEYASAWRVREAAYGEEDKATLTKIENYLTTQSMYSVIHTNVTRIGSLVMIIFLVTILAPLYRYCLRLAAFYDARSDAVLLQHAKVTTARFADVAASMTPTLDFGNPPPTPVGQLIALVRELRGSDKKDDNKSE